MFRGDKKYTDISLHRQHRICIFLRDKPNIEIQPESLSREYALEGKGALRYCPVPTSAVRQSPKFQSHSRFVRSAYSMANTPATIGPLHPLRQSFHHSGQH